LNIVSVARVGDGRKESFVVDFDVKFRVQWKCITGLITLAVVAFVVAISHEIQAMEIGKGWQHQRLPCPL